MKKRPSRVLIVESDAALGRVWQRHLERHGIWVRLEHDQQGALDALGAMHCDLIILDLILTRSSAFVIADEAERRFPGVPILFVSKTSFFSDGSVFGLCANARAFVSADTPPDDLTAMVEHYARSG
ncbi:MULTISPECIES: response regulator [Roseovarius]|uniref:response regulator n=1 Tax=Roseovarius TaxID=74030 RepID=UPI001C95DA81|nr:response regulator [Roseovarius atlanticus]MBY5989796.1 response regulator [Roseovarius atlanticus]MBY6126341.1 response regulator [Roseovarius atlanticus]MBY6150835.1 response regulator [Roseovarius atlanticus]